MKKTQLIELFNTIKKTKVSFISIAFFVLLATTGFLCISWSCEGFSNSIENALNEYNFEDCSVRFPYGIDDDYIEFIKQMDEIDDAEGVYQSFEHFKVNKMKLQARVLSLPKRINVFTNYEGTLPTNNSEIAIERFGTTNTNLKIGDTITFVHNDDGNNLYVKVKAILDNDLEALQEEREPSTDGMMYLTNDKYKITAILDSPEHISKYTFAEGFADDASQVDLILYVHDSAFDKEAFLGYSSVHLVSNRLRAYRTDTEEYATKCDELTSLVKEYSKTYTDKINNKLFNNKDTLLNDALEKIQDGEKQLVDAKKQLEDGKKQLSSAKKQVVDGKKQIKDGQAQIDYGYKQLNEGKAQLAEVESIYNETKNVIATASLKYDEDLDDKGVNRETATPEQKAESSAFACEYVSSTGITNKLTNLYNKNKDVIDSAVNTYANQLSKDIEDKKYEDAEGAYNSLCTKIDTYIADAKHQIEVGEGKLWLASCDIIEAKGKLANAQSQIKTYEKKLEDAKIELADGEEKLIKAKEDYEKFSDSLKELKTYDVSVMGRRTNTSIITTKSTNTIMSAFKYTMSSLFVIVGALVGYTSISRLVHEQVISIGTKKALGLSQKEITKTFVIYTLFACVIGIVAGLLLTRYVAEPGIVMVLGQNFLIEKFEYYFGLKEFIIFALIQITISVSAAYLASRKILKKKAIKLLAGPEEVIGKERFYHKFWLYKKLPLLNKTIINNFFNDSRRVFATLVGIAGCTSLLVSSLYLYFSINTSIDKQKYVIGTYDYYVSFDSSTDSAQENLTKVLDDMGVEYLCYSSRSLYIQAQNGNFNRLTITAYDDERIYDYIHLINIDEENKIKNNVYLSNAFANWNNLDVNDSVNVIDSSGIAHKAIIEGIFERYLLSSEMVMTDKMYEEILGDEYADNTIIVKSDIPLEELNDRLSSIDGYISITSYRDYVNEECQALARTSLAIVIIFFVLSITLAFLVLLNLLVMFVDEKKKELIVMMINGYSRKDAKKYIYSDTIILTIIGIIFGSLLGTVVGIYCVKSLDSASTCFITSPIVSTYIVSTALTFAMCLGTTLLALRKIDKFKLTDINSK